MDLKQITKQVSNDLDIPEEVVKLAYKSYWEFIRNTIKQINFKANLTEEEFSKLKTNFNIPALGKLYCNYERYINNVKRFKIIKKIL